MIIITNIPGIRCRLTEKLAILHNCQNDVNFLILKMRWIYYVERMWMYGTTFIEWKESNSVKESFLESLVAFRAQTVTFAVFAATVRPAVPPRFPTCKTFRTQYAARRQTNEWSENPFGTFYQPLFGDLLFHRFFLVFKSLEIIIRMSDFQYL